MRAYFNHLPMRTWLLVMVPAVLVAYPVVRLVIALVVRAVVPDMLRSLLGLL